MPEIGIPYTLTGPDGTRAVFNDPTDIDFVGYLDSENGITGLLDTADVRESTDVKPEGDGGIQGDNFLGRRTGTLQGIVWPLPDIATVNIRVSKINRASRGLRSLSPSTLQWTPTGGVSRSLSLWRQGRNTYSGRRPKQFVVPLATVDSYTYATDTSSQDLILLGSAGDTGISSPITSPLSTVYNPTAQGIVINQGDAETWPVFVFQGPMSNPGTRNNTTGKQWQLIFNLGVGEFIVVDTKFRTVLFEGNNRYSAYAANFANNTWWSLMPGANDIRLLASSYSSPPAEATIYWRHAWE